MSPALVLLGISVGLALGACEDGQTRTREREVVARIGGEGQELALERAILDELVEREGLTPERAREHALSTLRLVAARRAEIEAREQPPLHPDDLDPARRDQLERSTLVRLWLDEHFEPENDASSIPRRVIDANMADPSLTQRLFHPKLWFVCQALLVPIEKGEDGRHLQPPADDPEAALAWTGAAEAALAPVLDRVERFESDLLSDGSCELFGRIIGTSKHVIPTPEGELALRYEHFAFAPSESETFDPVWVEQVSAFTKPTIIAPFRTQFGLHLVLIGKIVDAQLEAGALPKDELETARRAHLREEISTPWRGERLQETLTELRQRRVVRLSPELESSP